MLYWYNFKVLTDLYVIIITCLLSLCGDTESQQLKFETPLPC